jgi:hypothetical protein
LGIEEFVLENSPSDTATVVLLPQTPHLDMQLVTDVGWVDYAGEPEVTVGAGSNHAGLTCTPPQGCHSICIVVFPGFGTGNSSKRQTHHVLAAATVSPDPRLKSSGWVGLLYCVLIALQVMW